MATPRSVDDAAAGHGPGLSAVAATVDQFADRSGVAPDDVRVLMAQYPGDVPLWDEAGVLAPEVGYDAARIVSPYDERTIQH